MSVAELIKPDLDALIVAIGKRNMYSGNKISDSIMRLFVVELRADGAGILVPYWIGVLQRGRGPRRSTKSSGLHKKIYKWMEKNNMFTSATTKGRINEAKSMTWYINKYGNKQFRSKVFIDIYETERKKTITRIEEKISAEISKITMDVI